MGFFSGIKDFFKDNKEAIGSGLAVGSFGLQLADSFLNQRQLKRQNEQVDEQNALARESFDYNKYLNENRYQISAMDAQKAGINPIAMTGANLTSSSVSPAVSPSRNSTGLGSEGLAMLSSILLEQKKLKTEKEIADNNNDTAIEVAEINAGASKSNAQTSSDTTKSVNDANIKATAENLTRQQQHEILMLDREQAQRNYETRLAFEQALAEFNRSENAEERNFNFERARLIMDIDRFWQEAKSGRYTKQQFETGIGKIIGDISNGLNLLNMSVEAFSSGLYKIFTGKDSSKSYSSYLNSMLPTYKRSEYAEWFDKGDK